jgi:predicted transcriptional regulator
LKKKEEREFEYKILLKRKKENEFEITKMNEGCHVYKILKNVLEFLIKRGIFFERMTK